MHMFYFVFYCMYLLPLLLLLQLTNHFRVKKDYCCKHLNNDGGACL
uniref:Macaca fascicularis brain cDNA clone: QflA-20544, similar to human hypothetical protein KIAA1875 (KIAA1875), mRNA, RefSeq: XM_291269.2 n=1 Tax=Macaca fascicularis TaxID=9541 RepID=I7G6L2_MACFA|nr:unnamed protein product [Macaca fascicularis]